VNDPEKTTMLDTLSTEMSNVEVSNVETSVSEGSPERDDTVSLIRFLQLLPISLLLLIEVVFYESVPP
jgi:hypothetical protein